MSQSIELPLDSKCYLCDSYYVNVCQSFIIYKFTIKKMNYKIIKIILYKKLIKNMKNYFYIFI